MTHQERSDKAVGDRLHKATEFGANAVAASRGDDAASSADRLDFWNGFKAALEALSADGPVAVLPGGRVVGMEESHRHSWECGRCMNPAFDCTCDPRVYRLVADEEDGDE